MLFELRAVLIALAVAAGFVSELPALSGTPSVAGGVPALFESGAAWLGIVAAWFFVTARHTAPAARLWSLPSALFRTTLVVGVLAVAGIHLYGIRADAMARVLTRGIVATELEDALYELGVIALASLAAFATARSILRPSLLATHPPAGARDIALRTRFVVATTGAAFATAGILLNVLIDFDATPDATLLGYLGVAAALVAFSALIGWLVGDDAARGVVAVTERVRELAEGRRPRGVPVMTADEVGDLARAVYLAERAAATVAERERVARELHDGVAKSVSALALEVAALGRESDPATAARLARIEHLSRELAEELRAIVRDIRLRPEESFDDSLRRVVAGHPAATLELAGDLERADPLVRFQAARILDEALRNVDSHAAARRARARVSVADGRLRLVVEDDGRGVGAVEWDTLAARGHFGLLGMRERAQLLGGELRLESPERGGTRLVVELPVTGGHE